jgi:hypothetical protein
MRLIGCLADVRSVQADQQPPTQRTKQRTEMEKVSLFTSHLAAVLAILQLWLIISSASTANRVWIVRRDVESVTETNSQNVS